MPLTGDAKRAWDRAYRKARHPADKVARVEEYRRRREALIARMGGVCVFCRCSVVRCLEFDHDPPSTRTWSVKKTARLQRMRRYERDYAAGHLRLLCHSCNANAGHYRHVDEPEEERALAKMAEAASA
jgi:hypothetical protein